MRADLDPKAMLERLRDLPPGDAPYGYAEFSHRYSRRRIRQTQRPLRLLAAAVAVVIAGWVVKHDLAPVIGARSCFTTHPAITTATAAASSRSGRWVCRIRRRE